MKTDKIDYKLLNYLILFGIILIIYQTKELWLTIINTITTLLKPILISWIISYVCNIYLRKLNKIFNKLISIIIFITSLITIIYLLLFKMSPIIINQIIDSSNIFIYFIKKISIEYNIDLIDLYNYLDSLKTILPINITNIINSLFKYISLVIIVISLSIYIFIDFNKIKSKIKMLSNRNKYYNNLKKINKELEKYTTGFLLLSLINILEYGIIFKIINHPNYLFLGILAGILSIIPIFGGIITNIIALITASVINYGLLLRTIIGILILSIIDGYIISPYIYKKSNKIHPIISIITVFIGTKLFGLLGTILAIPTLIIIINIYKIKKYDL